jgi:predicted glycosyltransferase
MGPLMRRIAFYSYDEHGLGHVRRSIAIAHALSAAEPTSILLIAGAREAALFKLPEGTDTLALPAPGTDFNGTRRGPDVGLDRAGTVRVRARALRNALAAFDPEVLIVDRMPLGVHDELRESLGVLRAMGTRLVLGLREILDDPDRIREEFERSRAFDVLRRSYDGIWVYGDPRVYDLAAEYDLPDDIRGMVRFTGYLDRRAAERSAAGDLAARRRELRLPDGRMAVCVLGGGEDGHSLAAAFARADLPAGCTGVVVAGPFMPDAEREAVHALAAGRSDLRVIDFVPDAESLIGLADDVVAMGGYSTVCEILASRSRALLVPRAEPRHEQVIRARRLSALGLTDMLDRGDLTPSAISAWLAAGGTPHPALDLEVDTHGLARVPRLLDDLVSGAGDATIPRLVEPPRFLRVPARRSARTGSVSA